MASNANIVVGEYRLEPTPGSDKLAIDVKKAGTPAFLKRLDTNSHQERNNEQKFLIRLIHLILLLWGRMILRPRLPLISIIGLSTTNWRRL